jgi:hypothetical protein
VWWLHWNEAEDVWLNFKTQVHHGPIITTCLISRCVRRASWH